MHINADLDSNAGDGDRDSNAGDGNRDDDDEVTLREWRPSSPRDQFMVKMIPMVSKSSSVSYNYRTLVIRAKSTDLVSVIRWFHSITGIPRINQRFIYSDKLLDFDNYLSDYVIGICNDSVVQLASRIRRIEFPEEIALREWCASSRRVQFMVKTIPVTKSSVSRNSTLVIRAYSTDVVSVIVDKVHSVTSIPQNEQRFVYSGKMLDFDNYLTDYGICIGNDIVVKLASRIRSIKFPEEIALPEWRPSSRMVQFMVKTIPVTKSLVSRNRTLVIRAYSTDVVSVIGDKVHSVTSIPQNEQRFVYSGKLLDFDNYLSDYGISIDNNSIVQLASCIRSIEFPEEIALREWRASSRRVQFMIKTIPVTKSSVSRNRTLVIRAYSTDAVSVIGDKVHSVTGIPQNEQGFVYSGKQLELHKCLSDYGIGNDSVVHLVSRIRSISYPRARETLDKLLASIHDLGNDFPRCTQESLRMSRVKSLFAQSFASAGIIISMLKFQVVNEKKEKKKEKFKFFFDIFMASSIPKALVELYNSSYFPHECLAGSLIEHFLEPSSAIRIHIGHRQAAAMILRFCNMLRLTNKPNPLYLRCRESLADLLRKTFLECEKQRRFTDIGIHLNDLLPFAIELASSVTEYLSTPLHIDDRTLSRYLSDFNVFLLPLRTTIKKQGPISFSRQVIKHDFNNYGYVFQFMNTFFHSIMVTMNSCLVKVEKCLDLKRYGEAEECHRSQPGLPAFLSILKEIGCLSKLFFGGQKKFQRLLSPRSVSVYFLIKKYVKRNEKCKWLVRHKEAINFKCRRHLAMMLLPEKDKDYQTYYEMLIDRSKLLEESFEYIERANLTSLHKGLFMEFKNEEATGPGVLREWFCLVCQAIFNQHNALFVACPSDRQRFYPNPVSKVDPLQLKYFKFCGRMIAMALMYKVQVGVVLDRVFFLQLAGMPISLEDIRDADPCLYKSCKQMLEMDADFVDTDALGLTFVREIEELGSRRVVKLCPGGENLIVNSTNRERYVNLLVENHFVTSMSREVDHFAQGFADILVDSNNRELFFKNLLLEDLDCMLRGSETGIRVEDWQNHTDYSGYNESDWQISCFWKVVWEMSLEQKKVLLFFWTSVKYLPIEGFRGLASRLQICRTTESASHLPSAHTCFYQLCFPAYRSYPIMKERFRIITQEHMGYSFGNA